MKKFWKKIWILSNLPINIEHIQLGEPLNNETKITKIGYALVAILFALEKPHLQDKPVSVIKWLLIAIVYWINKMCGLGKYCTVIQAGVMFEIDSGANEKYRQALHKQILDTMPYGALCHGCDIE